MRGIGCVFMIIVPIFSYAVGSYLAGQNIGWGILPPEWYGRPTIPSWLVNFQGLSKLASYLTQIQHLGATLAIGFVVLVVVGGIVSIIYGYMYSIFAPSKYGPLDIPPPRVKTKKYKR